VEQENYYYEAVGRRKAATARVRLALGGSGAVVINGKPLNEYFGRLNDILAVKAPLALTGNESRFDVTVLVKGGGVTGQSEAVRHGIARALLKVDEGLRPALRKAGYLTRDPRAKERKKPGFKRARKKPQYTKR
jgi:small subunit ribosomal protein S9